MLVLLRHFVINKHSVMEWKLCWAVLGTLFCKYLFNSDQLWMIDQLVNRAPDVMFIYMLGANNRPCRNGPEIQFSYTSFDVYSV